jgi:phage/plasmid-associated DNA primase
MSNVSSLQVMFSQADCELVTSLFQRALTFSEGGDSTFDKMLVMVGSGNNGKSYLMNALQEAFPSKVEQGVKNEVVRVDSKRIVYIEDGCEASWVKETLAANPNTLYVLLCNRLPFNPEDQGLFRRLQVVKCNDHIRDALKHSDIRKTIELFVPISV